MYTNRVYFWSRSPGVFEHVWSSILLGRAAGKGNWLGKRPEKTIVRYFSGYENSDKIPKQQILIA